jgi:hypothetical protein
MDSKQSWFGVYYDWISLMKFLSTHRDSYKNNKKYLELQIASQFARSLSNDNKKEYLIGIPTLNKIDQNAPPNLRSVIEDNMAFDEDFDIVLAPRTDPRKEFYKLQLVRFVGDVQNDTEGLFAFLMEKKFEIQKDKQLLLLVNIEKNMKLNYIELSQKFQKVNVPYGQIFIIGQRKPDDSYIYFCVLVYPEVKELADLDFSFVKRIK